ncbi:MAG: OmpH family outer membrane protein [Paludibacter sp.]|nr:OmpH family outer membrane protein [Bacteroidales bacterium]MCM1069894.1 OmpH family outer membrane protein [Prevotella sp.]MCM1354575.1 OmpH family outer membrane protein [Bacteroides sp.]MCM1443470.1 OmpH family outer membrane protein [Muribaculum sp.]MCM1482554.1 OmpH family outer membrane protein [Paludibacter sp.]
MNKTQIIFDSVLIALVIGLFVFVSVHVSKSGKTTGSETAVVCTENSNLPIAYLNIDTLLTNYTFAQEANEKLMSKQEDARLKLNSKARTLQNEMADFQRKLDNNAFLSRERAESEANRLQKKQQELQDLEAKLTQDIMVENQNLNLQLRDTLDTFLKQFNADGKYQIILANTQGDNVLLAQPGHDITDEVVTALNKRYKSK